MTESQAIRETSVFFSDSSLLLIPE